MYGHTFESLRRRKESMMPFSSLALQHQLAYRRDLATPPLTPEQPPMLHQHRPATWPPIPIPMPCRRSLTPQPSFRQLAPCLYPGLPETTQIRPQNSWQLARRLRLTAVLKRGCINRAPSSGGKSHRDAREWDMPGGGIFVGGKQALSRGR